MKLHGSISDNLRAAVKSAERLRARPVHSDTLAFWQGLLTHAQAEKRNSPPEEVEAMERLIGELQRQIFARE